MTKQLIFKSIRNIILDYFDFDFIICQTINVLNKRPIAFKQSLRNLGETELPFPITPESLIKGYEVCTLNLIPQAQNTSDEDTDPSFDIRSGKPDLVASYEKLVNVRNRLREVYHSEFLATLITQAVDKSDRYKPVKNSVLKPGDIVLLVEEHSKRYNYPLGKVQRVETNSLGETTAAYIYKGTTREVVYRHATSLIRYISVDGFEVEVPDKNVTREDCVKRSAPVRAAARACRSKLKTMATDM